MKRSGDRFPGVRHGEALSRALVMGDVTCNGPADSCPLVSEAQKDAARFDAPETIFLILL